MGSLILTGTGYVIQISLADNPLSLPGSWRLISQVLLSADLPSGAHAYTGRAQRTSMLPNAA